MKQKKTKRSEYISRFEKDSYGQYAYTGSKADIPETWKKTKRNLYALSIAVLCMQIITGCLPAESMRNTFYVLIPYLLTIGTILFSLYHLSEIKETENTVSDFHLEHHALPLKNIYVTGIVFCLLTAAGIILFMAVHGTFPPSDILAVLIECISGGVSYWSCRISASQTWFHFF